MFGLIKKTINPVPKEQLEMQVEQLTAGDEGQVVDKPINEGTIIDRIKAAMPFFKASLNPGVGLYLFDQNQAVWCEDSVKGAIFRLGDKIIPGSVPEQVLSTGQPVTKTYTDERFATPYIMAGVPVTDEHGNVRGVFIRVRFEQSTEFIREALEPLQQIVTGISEKITDVSANSQQLSAAVQNISNYSAEVASTSKEISNVIGLINDIASKTHILGINATIEAAHAGEHGRGFSVVAGEIQKMSNKTKEATATTGKRLQDIQNRIQNLSQELAQMSGALQNLTEVIMDTNQMINNYEKAVVVAIEQLEQKMQTLFK